MRSLITKAPYKFTSLYRETIEEFSYEDKPMALSKQLKEFKVLPAREEYRDFTYNNFMIIDDNYKRYPKVDIPTSEKVEEVAEKQTTVFDLLDDLKDE